MNERDQIGRPWFLAVTIAVGFAVAWGLAVMFLYSLTTSLAGGGRPHWDCGVLAGGTPFVEHSRSPNHPLVYETLDRKPIPTSRFWGKSAERYTRASAEELPVPARSLSFWAEYDWRQRMEEGPVADTGGPSFWYLVHDGRPEGLAYFVGYNAESYRLAGYVGRKGFQAARPAPDDCFPMSPMSKSSIFGGKTHTQDSRNSPESSRQLSTRLLSGDQLYRIDWFDQMVHVVYESPGLESIGTAQMLGQKDRPNRLLLRTASEVIVFDWNDTVVGRYVIPESLRGTSFRLFPMGKSAALIQTKRELRRAEVTRHRFVWITDQGKIERDRSVDLPARSWRENYPAAAAIFSLGPVLVPVVAHDVARHWSGEYPNYASALAAALADMWPIVAVATVLGVVCALLCYRRQKRYNQPWTWVWVVTVLLFGLPGFVGYLFHRRWPAIEPCPSCEALAPRDRPACYVCGQEFPRPARKGTEVFA